MNRSLMLAVLPALVCVSVSARAGFEWVPPTKTDNAPVMAAPLQAEPSSAVFDQGASSALVPMPDKPVAVTTTQTTRQTTISSGDVANAPLAPAAPDFIVRSEPTPAPETNTVPATRMGVSSNNGNAPRDLTPPVESQPVIAQASVTTVQTTAPANPDLIQGFGRDVPLTIATRQIVPSDHTVQYAPGVDPSTNVTWTGGRSWKEALNDALAEKNLKAIVIADSVMIEPVAGAALLRAEPLAAAAPLPPIANEVRVENTSTVTTTTTAATDMVPDVTVVQAAPQMPGKQMWVAPRASTLRQVLTDWTREAGVQMQWSAQYDYPLMSDVQIGGTFEEAVETLLSGLVDAQPRPVARLHPNEPNGPAILVVETRHILE